MNKEQKVTSLELSKKIYELAKKKGIKLESEYVWVLSKSLYNDEKPEWYLTRKTQTKFFKFYKKPKNTKFEFGKIKLIAKCDYEVINKIIPALDTAELGEILPGNIDGCVFQIQKGIMGKIYYCSLVGVDDGKGHQKEEKTMVEAMGKMYFYLLDNNLL